jgi:retron-type reverse transcriptase
MKRIGNLYNQICSIENLELADRLARRGKQNSYGIRLHDKDRKGNIERLHYSLVNKTFKTSDYSLFNLKCSSGKMREIARLPYYPDRIVHHAVMNVLEPIWISVFTQDTYSCIKGRGIHLAVKRLKSILKSDLNGTKYCLKMDVRKFYPSVDHACLKQIVRKKIKDQDLLWLLDEIIDSSAGVPIGNYLSQYFANLYLSYFDHWIKEELHCKYYFRYCDDMVILGSGKEDMHELRQLISQYLENNLHLQVKNNWQVFPVGVRGIDFLGYRFFHTHTLLRKSIKQAFARACKLKDYPSMASYYGWASHCNSYNLLNKLNYEEIRGAWHQARIDNGRLKDQHYQDTEQANNCVESQDRRQQVSKEQVRQVPVFAN